LDIADNAAQIQANTDAINTLTDKKTIMVLSDGNPIGANVTGGPYNMPSSESQRGYEPTIALSEKNYLFVIDQLTGKVQGRVYFQVEVAQGKINKYIY